MPEPIASKNRIGVCAIGRSGAIVTVVLSWTVAAIAPKLLSGQETADHEFSRSVQRWEELSLAVQSIRIRYRELRQGGSEIRPQTLDSLSNILASHDLGDRPDSLRDLAAFLLTNPGQFETPWSVYEFFRDGERYKDDHGHFQFVYDGSDQISRVGVGGDGENISIGTGPRTKIADVDFCEFIFCPSKLGLSSQRPNYSAKQLPGARQVDVIAHDPEMWLQFTLNEFGYPEQVNQLDLRGLPINAWWYYSYRSKDGVMLPIVSCHANFVGDVLNMLCVRVIESADVNSPVDPSVFTVPVETGTPVFDYRAPGDPRRVAAEPHSNVKEVRFRGLSPPATVVLDEDDTSAATQSYVIWINVSILSVGACWFMYRRFRRKSHR